MKTVTMALCLVALTWVGTVDLRAQDTDVALAVAILAVWGTFDVPETSMEGVSAATARCQQDGAGVDRIRCDLTHRTSNSTVCRGASVAHFAGAVLAVAGRQHLSPTTFTTVCSRHRVVIEFVPDGRTTLTEYERSSGDVIYSKSIRS